MDYKNILETKFRSMDFKDKITIKDYFKELLKALWQEVDDFSGKRPLGNSYWQYDVYAALVVAGAVDGTLKENGGVDEIDEITADKIVLTLIDSL